jgi:hypothetical protein
MRDVQRGVGRSGRFSGRVGVAVVSLALLLATAAPGLQRFDLDEEPIRYTETPAQDRVSRLRERMERGEVSLRYEPEHGYLKSVLQHLDIPLSSQVLVFSKTSLQRQRISPLTPRAIYFNDDTYIGWVQGGEVLEVSTADPKLGAVFYTLEQRRNPESIFLRQTHECLSCHTSSLTRGVPGHTFRSVYSGRDGLPILSRGTFITTPESPLEERWGGWYVTGQHGEQRHMGNRTFRDAEDAREPTWDTGANLTDLRAFFNTSRYLTPHSDLVALMVGEHQTHVQNLITRARYETLRALYYEETVGRELGRQPGELGESSLGRIRSTGEPLLRALLFVKEAPLAEPVVGTSGFAEEFARGGPRDRQGRSLRQLDLHTRMFRYPLSYLIHSEAFDSLPDPAKEYVFRRLREVLNGEDADPMFSHLTDEIRRMLREHLADTKPEALAP